MAVLHLTVLVDSSGYISVNKISNTSCKGNDYSTEFPIVEQVFLFFLCFFSLYIGFGFQWKVFGLGLIIITTFFNEYEPPRNSAQ